MALEMARTHLGLNVPNAYYKIVSSSVTETTTDDVNNPQKEYDAKLTLNCYTDSTKEYHIDQTEHEFHGFKENDFTLNKAYDCLKSTDEFSTATDV